MPRYGLGGSRNDPCLDGVAAAASCDGLMGDRQDRLNEPRSGVAEDDMAPLKAFKEYLRGREVNGGGAIWLAV